MLFITATPLVIPLLLISTLLPSSVLLRPHSSNPNPTPRSILSISSLQSCLTPSTILSPTHRFVHSISTLPETFEPSDSVWDDKEESLYVVDDSGGVVALGIDGEVKTQWTVKKESGKGYDLEGITIIKDRPDVLFLASEYPPTILEFSKSKSTVIRSWDLSPQFGYRKKDGLEAITFVPDSSVPTGGYFYVGRQRDARIFVFDVPAESKSDTKELNFRGFIIPPGPGFDLSALYYHNSTLYLLFDKAQVLIPISLPANSNSNSEVKSKYLPSSESPTLSLDASRDHVTTIPTLERGQEAISIAMVDGVSYVFFGIDVNGKRIKNSFKHENDIKVSVQGSNGVIEDEIYIRKPVRGLRRYTC